MNPVERSKDIAINVAEEEKSYKVRAVLPGLDVEKLDISILGQKLKISGEFIQDELPEGGLVGIVKNVNRVLLKRCCG